MASFSTNLIQKYIDSHAQPVPDYPQPITYSNIHLNKPLFLAKKYGRFASVGNLAPASVIFAGFFLSPYLLKKYNEAQAAAAEEH